jgi:hypothetical protein
MLIQWRDGTTTWEPLKDLKESNPVQVAEYAALNQIADEPAFAWWVKTVLRRRDHIISKVKSRYWKKTHKYSIEVPTDVNRAMEIDKETGTDFWKLALGKEMKNVRPAFNILDDGAKRPIGYKEIRCHLIFDIKMDFTRKARFVAGGHMTDPPSSITYSSIVSRESVRIAFTIAALNDLDVLCTDIGNAYLNAPCREQCMVITGMEFGADKGRWAIIVRALYGLKSSGAAWRVHLAQTMMDMGFKSCLADPDVWLRAATKADGTKYYEYVLIYVDDILAVSSNPSAIMDTLSVAYRLKEDPTTGKTYARPTRYLGADIGHFHFDDETDKARWFMSADTYVKNAIKTMETQLEDQGLKLKMKVSTTLPSAYRPELDVPEELNDKGANQFQELIGILRWSVKLGRIDIATAVSHLSSFLAAPRRGLLEAAYHIFAYLKAHARSKLVFDDTLVDWHADKFTQVDWTDFYPDAAEALPPNAPEARGEPVQLNCFVDADHAGNKVTRKSHSGILIYLNSAPIDWYSKQQNTVESSSFGSKFIALRIAVEKLEAIRYKLRMMGIPLMGPANVFCDNESVVKSSTRPESTLKKKHVSICYHKARKFQAGGSVRIAWESGKTNLADLLTKILPGPRLANLIQRILW